MNHLWNQCYVKASANFDALPVWQMIYCECFIILLKFIHWQSNLNKYLELAQLEFDRLAPFLSQKIKKKKSKCTRWLFTGNISLVRSPTFLQFKQIKTHCWVQTIRSRSQVKQWTTASVWNSYVVFTILDACQCSDWCCCHNL